MCAGDGGLTGILPEVSELKIGYARVSTDAQDLTAQRDALQALGVDAERICVDHGLTGTHRDRPGLRLARGRFARANLPVPQPTSRISRSGVIWAASRSSGTQKARFSSKRRPSKCSVGSRSERKATGSKDMSPTMNL
jgi:hypothetical protein